MTETTGQRIARQWRRRATRYPSGRLGYVCICHTVVWEFEETLGAGFDHHFAESGVARTCPRWIDHHFPRRYGEPDD